jgi:hypothetical protein
MGYRFSTGESYAVTSNGTPRYLNDAFGDSGLRLLGYIDVDGVCGNVDSCLDEDCTPSVTAIMLLSHPSSFRLL